jgi:hypothetical protein
MTGLDDGGICVSVFHTPVRAYTIGVILLTVAGFLLYKKKRRQKTKFDRETLSQNEQPELVQARAPEAAA